MYAKEMYCRTDKRAVKERMQRLIAEHAALILIGKFRRESYSSLTRINMQRQRKIMSERNSKEGQSRSE